jgi:hypothetical protein
MNYFFTISNNFLKCNLTIPRFQNRGLIDYTQELFSAKIYKNQWIIKKEKVYTDKFFFFINQKYEEDNKIYFLSDLNLDNVKLDTLDLNNRFLLTDPAFRSNLRIENKAGGFSSYQSEYPSSMVKNRGNILSQVSSLTNVNSNKNIIFFKNIYTKPIYTSFQVYIIDIQNNKILFEKKFFTNTLNYLELKKNLISPNNFFLSDGFLGIPVYYIENNGSISLEHTHPLQTYIVSQDKNKIIKKLKENAKKIIYR